MQKHHAILHRRLGPWTEALTLSNSRELILRPISPLDSAPLRAGFSTLSPEEVRLRFMHPITEMTPDYAHQLTNLQPGREFALVATEPGAPGEALVGAVARLSIDVQSAAAEFALLVGRPLSAMGLGSYMLRKLILYARKRKLKSIFGDVLAENTAMLNLCQRLGFEHHNLAGEHGIVRVLKKL